MPISTKKQEINRRRRLVSKLRHEGVLRQNDIAERLRTDYNIDVTQQTISIDCAALDRMWRNSALTNTDKWKKEIIGQYKFLYQQAMTAWELSLEDKEAEIIESVAGGGNGAARDKIQQRTEGQSGNPAHWANAEKALKGIRDIVGLDAAKGVDHNVTGKLDLDPLLTKALERIYGDNSDE